MRRWDGRMVSSGPESVLTRESAVRAWTEEASLLDAKNSPIFRLRPPAEALRSTEARPREFGQARALETSRTLSRSGVDRKSVV